MKLTPTSEEREQIRILLKKADEDEDVLTEWEQYEFLPNLQLQTRWSDKQLDVLDAIWKKVME